MTKKMFSYLGLASVLLSMVLLTALTACASNVNSASSGGPQAKVSPTASGVMIAKKASKSLMKKASPSATPKPVRVLITPTQAPPVVMPTSPPVSAPVPTQVPIPVSNPGVSAAASAVLSLINQERASMGLKALAWDARLQASAHQHNLAMQAANTMSHQLPGEANFADRESAQGVKWFSAGENIGQGSGDPTQAAVGLNTMMFNETPPDDGHRKNILSTSSNIVGIDVITDSAHGKVWLTEDFAQI